MAPDQIRRLYVPITWRDCEQLAAVARAEHRRPQDQAAVFVLEGLKRAGALPVESSSTHCAEKTALEAAK